MTAVSLNNILLRSLSESWWAICSCTSPRYLGVQKFQLWCSSQAETQLKQSCGARGWEKFAKELEATLVQRFSWTCRSAFDKVHHQCHPDSVRQNSCGCTRLKALVGDMLKQRAVGLDLGNVCAEKVPDWKTAFPKALQSLASCR